ncbi:hypothetical protein ACEVN9_002747 [Acinetobacter baumannii]
MDKPITFNEWLGTQGNMVLLHANCCRIAFEGGQQSQQAKVEELQKQIDALEKSYFVLARIKSIASKNLLESILIKEVRQALKGEG